MSKAAWEPCEWTFGEKPLECHRLKVGRGHIYLHLRHRPKTAVDRWDISMDFGANSEDSYSSCINQEVSLEEAKRYIEDVVVASVGGRMPFSFDKWVQEGKPKFSKAEWAMKG